MSMVVLFHSDVLTLASTNRVIAAEEIGTLQSMLEQSKQLNERLAVQDTKLQDAETSAKALGYQAGFNAGKQEGLEAAAAELSEKRSELEQGQVQVQQLATNMAIEIVRKLADTLDQVELLSALAITAARSCSPDEPLVLRVHEQYRNGVAEKLKTMGADVSEVFRHVIGDATVEPTACIIESQASRILADLETQTQSLESQLVNG